ncbi:hypothetical protein [Longimicrobium sp.]|uniref:hypothetical protein n=1 Tax=Longimicrobium sp. TaxID=2029185 RepID=UPI002E3523CF|nr:hypothetical protein [Longimicrobium sp.]HEX6038874.1 hypothetical protein [Longimicrobium sp.]
MSVLVKLAIVAAAGTAVYWLARLMHRGEDRVSASTLRGLDRTHEAEEPRRWLRGRTVSERGPVRRDRYSRAIH